MDKRTELNLYRITFRDYLTLPPNRRDDLIKARDSNLLQGFMPDKKNPTVALFYCSDETAEQLGIKPFRC